MKAEAVFIALVRVFALLAVLQFGSMLWSLFRIAGLGGTRGIPSFVFALATALVGGVCWIYARDIGRWCLRKGAHPVETALRVSAVLYLIKYLALYCKHAAEWHFGGVISDGPAVLNTGALGHWSHAGTGLVILALCCVFMVASGWTGRLARRTERVRELRKEIE